MQATLEDFFKALRGATLEPSLDAQIDAARAVTLVGWSDREVLKHALGTTLAKSQSDREIFDAAFERFFVFDAFRTPADPDADAAASPGRHAAGDVAAGDGGGTAGGHGLAELLLSDDRAALARRLNEAARSVGMTDIWFFTQKGSYTQRIQRAMGLEQLDRDIASARRGSPQRAAALEQARTRLRDNVGDFVSRQLALYGTAPTQQLHDEFLQSHKLSHIEPRDWRRLQVIVRAMARRLAQRHARSRRQRQRGQLDVRRTLRRNAGFGGVPFDTVWRTRTLDRPRIVTICDVSGSVRAFARFLLLFVYSLSDVVGDIRSFAFSGSLVEVSDLFDAMPVEAAVDTVLRDVGGGSDYGGMLGDLERLLPDIDRRTTVLMLGDARNNRAPARADVMELLHRRARRVVWLNPEPRSYWGLGDSEMPRYAPHCSRVFECSTLRHLERVLDQLLRSQAAPA